MSFAHAGWCEACIARDLLFARANRSGQIFFVCAACSAAGTHPPTSSRPPQEQSIFELHSLLAPDGWQLASREEVEASGRRVAAVAPETYKELVSHYPGFHGLSSG